MIDAEQNDAGLGGPGLAEGIRAGEWSALEKVYRALVGEVWRLAYERLGHDRTGAEEVTSQVFLAVVQNAKQFDAQQATIERWVFGIARHKLADHLRGVYRDRKRLRLLESHPEASRPDAAVDEDRIDALRATLDRIGPPQRDLLLWKYRDGLSIRQIADRLRRSEKACENLLYRARNRFKVLYSQAMEET